MAVWSLVKVWALPASILAMVNISTTWYNLVSSELPEPYLDEVFHVPQASRYCKGDYSWDPKITTPPGLYLLTKVLEPLLRCDMSSMRALNAGAICVICPLIYGILRLLRVQPRAHLMSQGQKKVVMGNENCIHDQDSSTIIDAHSAFNMALFPPLFFFSALYYTDVISTLVVLLAYSTFIKKKSLAGSIFQNLNAVYLGVVAMSFRQTNVFWVAVFPAGLVIVDALTASKDIPASSEAHTFIAMVQNDWKKGMVHDCLAQNAGLQDYLLFLVTLVPAILRNLLLVIRITLPYISLLGLFAGFLFWNGSVVLGDRTAHVATIHAPQMLYIWPYIAFFSAPIIVGYLLPRWLQISCRGWLGTTSKISLPSFLTCALFAMVSLLLVHFNTIVHPYTLADNRHYVFYVFRLLRRSPLGIYLAMPAYFVCAWLSIQALSPLDTGEKSKTQTSNVSAPTGQQHRPPCKISFIVIWLTTTALSVVAAPLVEPRYFIVPWVIWRLHVPLNFRTASKDNAPAGSSYDRRLFLETVWHFAINASVAYVFLYRGFTWQSEPGKVQRFLW